MQEPTPRSGKRPMTTKTLVSCAVLSAISVVLARLVSLMPDASTRFSIEAAPIFLSGMLFGPLAGGLVGFCSDFVGCMMFSPFGYNPIFCVPPVLYGVFGGVFCHYLARKMSFGRLLVAFLPPVTIGSILYQSITLALMYFKGPFLDGLIYHLTTRSVQFGIVTLLNAFIILLLFRMKLFDRLGVWPPKSSNSNVKRKDPCTMNATEAIEYIHSVCWKGSVMGLERTQNLLKLMGNPEKKLKFVHIAGTNGKGSTAAMTASILQKAGYRTGLYTSPYIYRFHERMQVNGEEISDEELAAVTEYVKPLAESMEEHPTEFELVSCIAFEYFRRKNCDIVVLEVGMGGAMDSTNVIEVPEVAVITNIGLDHTEYLGDTVEKIAETKAGIFKENGDAVIYRSTPSVEAVLENICAQRSVKLKKADFDGLVLHSHSLEGQIFDCGRRKNLHLPLLGSHQLKNAAVVLGIIDTLIEKGWHITEENIRDGLRDTRWPGRFDVVGHDPLFIIDGGHNPQCFEALIKNIQDYLPGRKIIALTGVLADKDYADMYKPVLPYVEQFVCITPPNPRKLDAEQLAAYLQQVGAAASPCESIEEGVRTAVRLAGKDGVVLCFGSLYTIGSVRDALRNL